MRAIVLSLAMTYVFSSVCYAQDNKPLAVAITIGTTSSGAASDLESAMRAQGFADTSPAFIFGPTPHPFSRTGIGETGSPISLNVEYRIRKSLSIGGIVSNAPVGRTLGYHDPNQFISIEHGVTSFGATASLSNRIFRIGIGPAVHIAKASADGPSENHTKLGFVLDGGFRIPSRSRFFFDVDMQYRYVGRVTVGPFTTSSLVGSTRTLSPANIHFNHWYIGIGPGIRF